MKDVNTLLVITAALYLIVARAGWVMQNAAPAPLRAAVTETPPDRTEVESPGRELTIEL